MVQIGDMGNLFLSSVEALISFADHTVKITHYHVAKAHGDKQLANGNAGGTGSVNDDFNLAHLFSCDLHGVEHSGSHHNGGTVLVVVEDGDVAYLF